MITSIVGKFTISIGNKQVCIENKSSKLGFFIMSNEFNMN